MKNSKILALSVVLIGLNTSCEKLAPKKGQTNEIVVSIDLSDSYDRNCLPPANELYEYILGIADLDGTNSYQSSGAKIYFSYIGSDNRPLMKAIKLEPGTSALFDNTSKRKAKVAQFKIELAKHIEALINIEHRHHQTLIQNSITYQAEILMESIFSDKHTVITITDGVEEGQINFKQIGNEIDSKDSLSNSLNEISDLGDLSSFRFTFFTCPSTISYPNAETALTFWKFHLGRAGAREVKFRSNTINTISL